MNIIERPLKDGAERQQPKRIIVHSMGEYINNENSTVEGEQKRYFAPDWLEHLGLSAHVLVLPNGDCMRCRYDHQGAYHARGFNTNSLGVEFLVPGVHDYGTFIEAIKADWITEWQMQAGIELLKEWAETYDITDIQRHSDVSPGRKVDPGEGFPWIELVGSLGRRKNDK